MGSPLDHSGYACSLAAMIRDWRRYWTYDPGTTDALAPFGLVTIHPQGCEGNSQIGLLRHAQTANVGHAPNELLPNVFVAQAFDLGDRKSLHAPLPDATGRAGLPTHPLLTSIPCFPRSLGKRQLLARKRWLRGG